jgi:hypothetical protein
MLEHVDRTATGAGGAGPARSAANSVSFSSCGSGTVAPPKRERIEPRIVVAMRLRSFAVSFNPGNRGRLVQVLIQGVRSRSPVPRKLLDQNAPVGALAKTRARTSPSS